MKKTIPKLLTLVCLLVAVMGLSIVTAHAATVTGTVSSGNEYRYHEDKTPVSQWGPYTSNKLKYFTRNDTGETVPAYCMEPEVRSASGDLQYSSTSWSDLTWNQRYAVTLAMAYGYGGNYGFNMHPDCAQLATQAVIWEFVCGYPSNQGSFSDLQANEMEYRRYTGTEEYDPIIDEDMYEAAVSLKTARQCKACEKENDAIGLLRDFVRCDNCGQPMKRRVNAKHRIRESWNCTNDECGIRVHISDAQLIETITVLMNRIILNNQLLQPKPRKRYEPDARVTKVGNDIALELERDVPNEEYIIEKSIEMASLMYEQSNTKLNLAVSLAKKLAHTMVTQDEFNRDYFTALASYITLGEQGRVVLHTKTETEVTLDDGSNESP